MLTDSQIERYSRQIVLPEVGGRGQERLLAAVAMIAGEGEGALFCAAHLAAAGVGKLHLDGLDVTAPLATSLALNTRNVDCAVEFTPVESADLMVLLGDAARPGGAANGVLVWGREATEGIVAARFPTGRGCVACLAALADSAKTSEGSGQLLGALLAVLGLQALLGIGRTERAELFRLPSDGLSLVALPFPSRPGCPVCR